MQTTREDFVVGLLIVAAVGVIVGALIATSGWGERRYALYMRAPSAEGISVGTPVIVQGLPVGRVRSISPRVDSMSGRISFVAQMSVAERFADGSSLKLPAGTRAELVQASQISSAVNVELVLPDTMGRAQRYLQAGDTIDSRRRGSALDNVAAVAAELSQQVADVLRQTSRTLVRVQGTVAQAERTLRDVTPDVAATLDGLAHTMSRVDSVVGRLSDARIADSVAATIGSLNRVLLQLDSVATQAHAFTTENRTDLREAVANLTRMSRQLNHFVEEMSKRPYRLLTGVKPLASDTGKARDTLAASSIRP